MASHGRSACSPVSPLRPQETGKHPRILRRENNKQNEAHVPGQAPQSKAEMYSEVSLTETHIPGPETCYANPAVEARAAHCARLSKADAQRPFPSGVFSAALDAGSRSRDHRSSDTRAGYRTRAGEGGEPLCIWCLVNHVCGCFVAKLAIISGKIIYSKQKESKKKKKGPWQLRARAQAVSFLPPLQFACPYSCLSQADCLNTAVQVPAPLPRPDRGPPSHCTHLTSPPALPSPPPQRSEMGTENKPYLETRLSWPGFSLEMENVLSFKHSHKSQGSRASLH